MGRTRCSLGEAAAVAVFAALATVLGSRRRLSTVLAALGLFTCSAVLVHLSGGFIEMHFPTSSWWVL